MKKKKVFRTKKQNDGYTANRIRVKTQVLQPFGLHQENSVQEIIQRAQTAPQSLTHGDIMMLHSSIGNRATGRLLVSSGFLDGSPKQPGVAQRKLKSASKEESAEKQDGKIHSLHSNRENKTGLPNHLKKGLENISGISMDHVRVHYNSPRPASLQAHAYTKGGDIYLGPGQEKHLPHEGWHTVQQMQDRVRPTVQTANTQINDDPRLENEADVMGFKALNFRQNRQPGFIERTFQPLSARNVIQTKQWKTRLKEIKKTIENISDKREKKKYKMALKIFSKFEPRKRKDIIRTCSLSDEERMYSNKGMRNWERIKKFFQKVHSEVHPFQGPLEPGEIGAGENIAWLASRKYIDKTISNWTEKKLSVFSEKPVKETAKSEEVQSLLIKAMKKFREVADDPREFDDLIQESTFGLYGNCMAVTPVFGYLLNRIYNAPITKVQKTNVGGLHEFLHVSKENRYLDATWRQGSQADYAKSKDEIEDDARSNLKMVRVSKKAPTMEIINDAVKRHLNSCQKNFF